MRFFFIPRLSLIVITCFLVFGVAVGFPLVQVLKHVSPETREYWKDSSDIIWNVHTKGKMIALTFDDGPSPTFTPQVLDILKKNHVKATFFVIGREAGKYPDIIKRITAEGNEIANHTYNHKNFRQLTNEELRQELLQAESVILETVGFKPKLFRPPGGYYNEQVVQVSKELGYKVVLWSWEQQTGDWTNPGTYTIIRRVLNNAASGNIVVFHDRGGNRSQTVRALQPIIDGLKDKGYKMVSVSEMLGNSEPVRKTKQTR